MKVRCITVDFEQFPIADDQKALFRSGFGAGAPRRLYDHVEVGLEYVVYAIMWGRGYPYYYVSYKGRLDDWSLTPALCFEIVDDRASAFWHVGVRTLANGFQHVTFAIKEWIDEPMFLENLVDCRERELKIMTAAARAMDAEHGSA